jgi:hypothetical protein
VRELLTPALAGTNPKAYIAHFNRLEAEAQGHYLARLEPADLKLHFQTLGATATVGLLLDVQGPRLEATVGGARLGDAAAGECQALQDRALALGRQIDAKVVSGLVGGASLSRVAELEAALALVGWVPKTIVLAGDCGGGDAAAALGWTLRGAIGEAGSFYMPSEALLWSEREQVEAMLRDLATRTGATLDARIA